jgi:hypothetical protein
MQPVFDTSDLEAIAALEEPLPAPRPTLAVLPDRERYYTNQRAYKEAQWVHLARRLAAMGVRPAPSHTMGNNNEVWPSIWGAFWDARDIADQQAADHVSYPGAPLVLFGVEVDRHDLSHWEFPPNYPWMAVAHQTAGIACHHRYLIGIPLAPRPDRFNDIAALATFAHDRASGCVGALAVGLSDLVAYAALLDDLGLSAQDAWPALEEGCSPLDERCAAVLSDTAVPSRDERYPIPENATALEALRAGPPLVNNPWKVWVLGENCD